MEIGICAAILVLSLYPEATTLHLDTKAFLLLAATLAASCGPPPAPAAVSSGAPAQSNGAPQPSSGPEAGESQPRPAVASEAGDSVAVPGEQACDGLVPSSCSEGASPRERCGHEARRLAEEESAAASQAFLSCVRAGASGIARPDAACARARARCEQASSACDATRQAVDTCLGANRDTCVNAPAMRAATDCVQRCTTSAKLDGCRPEQCARIAEQLQACVAKCGDPAADADTCQKRKCGAQQAAHDKCAQSASECTIPERCSTSDLPACQAGHQVIDKCSARP